MRKAIEALFPGTRAAVLAVILLHPEKWWYLSDLAKQLGVTPSTLQRELRRLTEAGILLRRAEGNRVYFKVDHRCPFLNELQGLFLKTAGLVDIVRETLNPLRKKIRRAFIYGSIARGEELSTSDVDLLVVGELGLSDLTPYLKKAEARLGREIQAMVYQPAEFDRKVRSHDHFLSNVLSGVRLSIIGDADGDVEAASR